MPSTTPEQQHRHRLASILFSALLVTSILGAAIVFDTGPVGVVSASHDGFHYDDFEDGTYTDNWSAQDDTVADITTDSFWGSNSVRLNDNTSLNPNSLNWTAGPNFDTGDNFEIRGTHKPNGSVSNSEATVRLGITDTDRENQAMLFHNYTDDSTYLQTAYDAGVPSEKIKNGFIGTYVQFRMQFDGGTARVKVWEAGTAEPDAWQLERDFNEFEGEFRVIAGSGNHGREIYLDEVDAGGHTISGQVVDQHGEPIENTTVEAIGVNYDALNGTATEKEEKAQELLQNASDPMPDSWDPNRQLVGSEGVFETTSSEYVAMHTKQDWGVVGVGEGYEAIDADLEQPRVRVPDDEPVVFSVWDPGASGYLGIGERLDPIDRQLPGRTTSGTVVIEQLDPAGDVINTRTAETQDTLPGTNQAILGTTKNHEVAVAHLPPGVYRISTEGSELAYTVAVGDPQKLGSQMAHDLRDEAGGLSGHAQMIRDRLDDGTFARVTTTTNASGHYEIRIPRGVEKATVQAYKADSRLTDALGPDITDLKDAREVDFNGSIYLTPAPETHDVPKSGVTIEMYKFDAAPFEDLLNYEDLWQEWWSTFLDDPQAAADMLFGDVLETKDAQELETILNDLDSFYTDDDILGEVDDRTGHSAGGSHSDKTVAELRAEIKALEEVINELKGDLESGESGGDISDGTLDYSVEFLGDVDEEAVSVLVNYEDGRTEIVGDEYITVDQSMSFTGDRSTEVRVEDYPVSNDTAVADIAVRGVDSDGDVGEERDQIENPAFSGDIPGLDAVDVSSDRPGTDERVSFELQPESNTGYSHLVAATAYGPNGQQLNTTLDGERASFKTAGEGYHTVRAEFKSQSGHRFVESFRVEARDGTSSPPPTIRLAEGPAGTYALAGEGLDSAKVDIRQTDGGTEHDVTAITPGGEEVSNLHVVPAAPNARSSTMHVSVVSGPNEEALDRHVSVYIHYDRLSEDAIAYRNGNEPITRDASTSYGQLDEREGGEAKHVLKTYTDGSGEVDVEVNDSPTRLERALHWTRTLSPVAISTAPVVTEAPDTNVGVLSGGVAA